MRKFLPFIVAVLFLSRPAAAESSAGVIALDMNEAVEMAFTQSEVLKISDEKQQKLQNTYSQVKASVLPQITGDLGTTRFLQSPIMNFDTGSGPTSVPLKQDWETRANITLSQIVWSFGKIHNAVDLARHAVQMEDYAKESAKSNLRFGIKQAYLTLWFAAETVKITEDSHKNALKNMAALKERYQGGRISRVNNLKMEADVSARVPVVLRARTTYDTVAVSFKEMLGIDSDKSIELKEGFTEEFPEYDSAELTAKMASNEPVLKLLRKNIDMNRTMVKLKKSNFYPTIAGFASYGYGGEGASVYPGGNMQGQSFAGLTLNYTLWDSGVMASEYRKAINDESIASLEYEKQLKELKIEVHSALAEYTSSRKTYKANLEAQRLAQESYNVTLSSFKSGAVPQSMLNDAEIRLTSAKIESKTTLYNINMLIAKIEKITERGVQP